MTEQEEMAYFRAHGWEAWPCPMTMVPLFDAVRAGVPDNYTDCQPELAPIPKEYVDGQCWLVEVRGESMRDLDIHEGDQLLVRKQDVAYSGDIVVAHYDYGPTVKTYYVDNDDGTEWLVPGNEKYVPMPLGEGHQYQLFGVVMEIVHKRPSGDTQHCMKAVRKAKKAMKRTFTPLEIGHALKETVGLLRNNRQWFAVYRVLRDLQVVASYEGFTDLLDDIMAEEAPRLDLRDLRKLDVFSFAKPLDSWDEKNAPVAGHTFLVYRDIALAFRRALVGKDRD